MDHIAQIEDERAEVRAQRAEARAQRAEARRAEDSHTDKYYSEPVDNKLQQTLNRIAGTYELVENLGIYGYKTIYTVTINRDGTGRIVYNGGDVENFSSAHLSGSNKIVFNGNYGGTTFLLSGSGIDDESTRKYIENVNAIKIRLANPNRIYFPYFRNELKVNPLLKQNSAYADTEDTELTTKK